MVFEEQNVHSHGTTACPGQDPHHAQKLILLALPAIHEKCELYLVQPCPCPNDADPIMPLGCVACHHSFQHSSALPIAVNVS